MKTKTTYMIPAFAAIFALMFVAATPYVMAEPGEDRSFKDSSKMQKQQRGPIQIDGFVGAVQLTKDSNRESIREQITVSLEDITSELGAEKARLGVVANEDGEKYLVWKLVDINKDSESEALTVTAYIVDAGDASNIVTLVKELDSSKKKDRQGDGPRGAQLEELRNKISPRSLV